MPLTIELSPDVDTRLRVEAVKQGMTPERLAAGMLELQLPPIKRDELIALLDSWLDGDADEQRETGEAIIRGLNEGRSPDNLHFPPELKGKTW